MATEKGFSKSGYVLAFLAGAIGGVLATKVAPAVFAKMQEHCRQMMEAGCCVPSNGSAASSACCGPLKEASSKESEARGKAA